VLRVLSVGINNLPTAAAASLAELFGPLPALLEECLQQLAAMENEAGAEAAPALDRLADAGRLPAIPGFALDDIIQQARAAGYANCVDMIPAATPYRPALLDEAGNIMHAKPTAHGSQSAIVVGLDGQDRPNGADEICCDRLGRVRIRFHWQQGGQGSGQGGEQGSDQGDDRATCWVRVAQRSAGAGMGAQFLPRIGQEVLVHFLENDIDRPIIVGSAELFPVPELLCSSLYNGQGEGGINPTPGGEAGKKTDLAGGNSLAWHGASSDSAGQRNGAAQFGGSGYRQSMACARSP
jgi:uncharacterized protein involved in type VI secretion and phage assembly